MRRRLEWHMPQVDRVFDSRHILKIEQIEAAAHVLGKQLIIVVA